MDNNNNNNTFSSLDNVMTNHDPLLMEDSTMYPWNSIRSDPLGFDIFNSLLANKYVSSSSTSRSINVQETIPLPPPLYHSRPFDDSSNNMWNFGETSDFQAYSCGDNVPILSTFDENDFPFLVSNELSLSLANDVSDECSSEISLCAATTKSTRLASSEQGSCSSKDITNSNVSQVIFSSKYLYSVQEILSHFAAFSLNGLENNYPQRCYSSRGAESESLDIGFNNSDSRRVLEGKKNHLLELLQMVDDQYTHCIDEIHTVVSAFHAATELDPQIHTRFALQTISYLYKSLREKISKKILVVGSVLERGKEKSQDNNNSMFHQHCLLQQLKSKNHQIWRPQRGLPEKSVSVLRTWMFQNFLHPYPKDSEKHLLAIRSGLSRSQVSNWFINARVRLWKPMIEEMYAEMNKRKMNNSQIQGNGICKSVMLCQEKGQRRE